MQFSVGMCNCGEPGTIQCVKHLLKDNIINEVTAATSFPGSLILPSPEGSKMRDLGTKLSQLYADLRELSSTRTQQTSLHLLYSNYSILALVLNMFPRLVLFAS